MNTSKIKEIVKINPRTGGSNGTVYYFIVKMENWDEYPIKKGKMVEDWFKVGDELTYEIKKDGEYDKIFVEEKPFEKKSFGSKASTFVPKNPRIEAITMCMSYAKDLVIAGKVDVKNIESAATKLLKWAIDNINIIDVPVKVEEKKVEPVKEEPKEEEDLPF